MEGGRRWRIEAAGTEPVDTSGVRDPGVAALLAEGARRFGAKTPKIEVVDTTGAGDAFVAGFLAARLTGADIRVALGRAAGAGMTATTIIGGQPGGPNIHPDR
jgi:sugar/nucleoside kinase (ribokinase family)